MSDPFRPASDSPAAPAAPTGRARPSGAADTLPAVDFDMAPDADPDTRAGTFSSFSDARVTTWGDAAEGSVDASGSLPSMPGHAWPTPPLPAYPLPMPSFEAEPCEVEGRRGRITVGLLLGLDLHDGIAHVQVPPERAPQRLRFDQFRRITLKRKLAPLAAAMVADADGDAPSRLLAHHESQPYEIRLHDQVRLCGQTVGHVDDPAGLFLFAPVDAFGSVQRSFVPRVVIEQVQLGELIGQLLVGQQATDPQQLEAGLNLQQAQRNKRLGQWLVEHRVVTPEQLLAALDQQARLPVMRLGEALTSLGFITDAQRQEALAQQVQDRAQPLGELLIERGWVDAQQVRIALARKLGYPVVEVSHFDPEPALLRLLPHAEAQRLQALPLMRRGGRLVVAMADASRSHDIDTLQRLTGGPIAPTLADGDLAAAIETAYARLGPQPDRPPEAVLPEPPELVTELRPTAASPGPAAAARSRPAAPAERLRADPLAPDAPPPTRVAVEAPAASPAPASDPQAVDPPGDLAIDLPASSTANRSADSPDRLPPASDRVDPPADRTDRAELASSEPVTAAPSPTEALDARASADRHESPLLQRLSHLVLDALARGATSVQIETLGPEQPLQVRLRRNGRLEAHGELPASWRNALMARIKALADLDISESRRPQEGLLAFGRLVPQHPITLRVHLLPTHGGCEDVVLGLPARLKAMGLDQLGLVPADAQRLRTLVERRSGLIVCAGPARSGRTTSLHALLSLINRPDRRIWTLEDRIELPHPGLRQMEIHPDEGQTTEVALRSLMATDADVLMLGHIGDAATARLAVEAALQGRLVLGAMTARNAGDAVMRLLDQGVAPWDLSDALLAVHSQRLLRRLCSACRMSRPAKDTEVEEWLDGHFHGAASADPQADREALLHSWVGRHGRDGRLRRFQSPGCDRCHHTGLRGRLAVHEVLGVSRELRRLIRAGAPSWNLQRQAIKDGMRTLRQDALDKMIAGQLTLDEVRSVIDL